MEVFVGFVNGFTEELRPCRKLNNYFSQLGIELPPGYHTESNLQALDWIEEVADAL